MKRLIPYAKAGFVAFPSLAIGFGIFFKSVVIAIPFLVLYVVSFYFSGYWMVGGFRDEYFEDEDKNTNNQ